MKKSLSKNALAKAKKERDDNIKSAHSEKERKENRKEHKELIDQAKAIKNKDLRNIILPAQENSVRNYLEMHNVDKIILQQKINKYIDYYARVERITKGQIVFDIENGVMTKGTVLRDDGKLYI